MSLHSYFTKKNTPLPRAATAKSSHPIQKSPAKSKVQNGISSQAAMEKLQNLLLPLKLREWQRIGLEKLLEKRDQDSFFVSAFPGGGKTFFSLCAALLLKWMGRINSVYVMSPKRELAQEYWPQEAAKKPIALELLYGNSRIAELPSSYDGRSLTYQKVSVMNQAELAILKREIFKDGNKAFVILDEVHHMAIENSWGKVIEQVFGRAAYKLLLSGTPFRTKPTEIIPFARRKEVRSPDGTTVEYEYDAVFSYEEGLKSGDLRKLEIHTQDGPLVWKKGDVVFKKTFKDIIAKKHHSDRMKSALHLHGDNQFATSMLHRAMDKLNVVREKNKTLQGIIVSRDQRHALDIYKIMSEYEPDEPNPRLVISDKKSECDAILREFREKPHIRENKWIVTVKMVAEGTNIPNLAVMVYLTNVMTAMFVIQALGRIIRRKGKEDEADTGFLFVPADKRLIKVLKTLEQTVQQFVESVQKEEDNNRKEIESSEIDFPDLELIPYDQINQLDRFFKPISSARDTSGVYLLGEGQDKEFKNETIYELAKVYFQTGAYSSLEDAYRAAAEKHPEFLKTGSAANRDRPVSDFRTLQEKDEAKRKEIAKYISSQSSKIHRVTRASISSCIKKVWYFSYKNFGKQDYKTFTSEELDRFEKVVERVVATLLQRYRH